MSAWSPLLQPDLLRVMFDVGIPTGTAVSIVVVNPGLGRYRLEGTTMQRRRFEWMALARFRGRMVGLQRSNRTCTTALYRPTTATAAADLQSIDSIHCASIARDRRFARTATCASAIIRGALAFGWKSTRRGRSLASAAGYSDGDIRRREKARKPA